MRMSTFKNRFRAMPLILLLGLLMLGYQNCSSGVSFEAGKNNSPVGEASTNTETGTIVPTNPPPHCSSPYVEVSSTCVCPAGTNDVGTTCMTCAAGEKFNPMTLRCEVSSNTCPAGQTYDGHACVAISATCDSYVEVTSSKFAIPPRNAVSSGKGQVCYYAKLVGKVEKSDSTAFPLRRNDIVSRLHGSGTGNAPPHVMGSRELSFVLQGEREVVLAGDSHGGDNIYVDNFFLVEVLFPGLSKPNLWASGTADALPFDSKGAPSPILVGGQPVNDWHAYGNGGTSSFNPINMYTQLARDKEISFKGSALDCGSIGLSSDVYLLFR